MIKAINVTGPVSRKAGGLFESVRHLCMSLEARDLDIRVFGVADEFTQEDIKAWAPIEVSAFRPILHKQFGYSHSFYEEAQRYHPDIIHTHGLWIYSSIVTLRLHEHNGTPYLISPHGMLDPWAVANSSWKKKIAHALFEGLHLRNAACIRALCESELNSIRSYGQRNPVAVIPNGISLPAVIDENGSTQVPPWAPFIKPEDKVLFFLSRIHPKKGLANLLRAWAKNPLPENRVLALAGWDQLGHENDLKKLATELNIAWRDIRTPENKEPGMGKKGVSSPCSLLFLGPQFGESKAACYRSCDAFILPSFSEGLPMVILEAWAYGKPVLMTPECNLPEGFEVNAALRIEAEPDSIARALTDYFNTPENRLREIGDRGLELVKRNFTWPIIAARMRTVYDWMLGGGSPPDCVHFSGK